MPSRGAALHHFPHRSARLLAATERPVGLRQSKESFQQPAEKILGHSRIASPPTPPSRHKVERHPEISSLRSNGWAIRSASPRIVEAGQEQTRARHERRIAATDGRGAQTSRLLGPAAPAAGKGRYSAAGLRSASASDTCRMTSATLSGRTEIESMPASTRNSAK